MMNKIAVGLVLASLVALPGVATAQRGGGIVIGPGGVQVIPPGHDRDRDRGRDRRRFCDDVSQRQARRIARRVGIEEITRISERRDTIRVSGFDRRDDRITVIIDRCDSDDIQVIAR